MKNFKLAIFLFIGTLLFQAQPARAVDLSKVTLNGYIDLDFEVTSSNTDNPHGSFQQHHLSFLLDLPVNDRVSAYTHIEFDNGVNTAVQSGGAIVVENAFIRYTFGDPLQFRFGKELTPFGYFNELHDATPALTSVDLPVTINRADERGGKQMFSKWVTGVNVLGTLNIHSTILDYIFYVGNSENLPSVNNSEVDAARNNAFGGRINFQPYDWLQMGASFYKGDDTVSLTPVVNVPHQAIDFLLSINTVNLNFMSEYAISDTGGVRGIGTYGQFSYSLNRVFTPYYRIEFSRPDTNVSGNIWVEHIMGLNIKPVENLIFKAEFSHNAMGPNAYSPDGHLNIEELRIQVALYF